MIWIICSFILGCFIGVFIGSFIRFALLNKSLNVIEDTMKENSEIKKENQEIKRKYEAANKLLKQFGINK